MAQLPGACKLKLVNYTDTRKRNLILKTWCQLCPKYFSVSETTTRPLKLTRGESLDGQQKGSERKVDGTSSGTKAPPGLALPSAGGGSPWSTCIPEDSLGEAAFTIPIVQMGTSTSRLEGKPYFYNLENRTNVG